MTYYVVIDTNVLVSAMLSNHSDTATVILVEKMIYGKLIPIYNEDIMKEYREVLHRKKFSFVAEQIDYILSAIAHFGLMIEPSHIDEIFTDIKDLPFYEVVMEKRKTDDAYLVTGNLKHFPIKPFIVTPKEMIDIIEKNIV